MIITITIITIIEINLYIDLLDVWKFSFHISLDSLGVNLM